MNRLFDILSADPRKYVYLPLKIYWSLIFILTSIPGHSLPKIEGLSDKVEHLLAYSGLAVLVFLALYFKKKYNSKLICDQHEFYSNWIDKTAHMNTILGKIISRMSDWEKYERRYLNLADIVITVAKPLELNYIEKYNIKNIITVPNTPTKRIFNQQNIKEFEQDYT